MTTLDTQLFVLYRDHVEQISEYNNAWHTKPDLLDHIYKEHYPTNVPKSGKKALEAVEQLIANNRCTLYERLAYEFVQDYSYLRPEYVSEAGELFIQLGTEMIEPENWTMIGEDLQVVGYSEFPSDALGVCLGTSDGAPWDDPESFSRAYSILNYD